MGLCAAVSAGGELPKDTNSLKTLTVEQAKVLAADNGTRGGLRGVALAIDLSLNGLTDLSAEVASELARHEGRLSLNGLTVLSDEAAEALAKHKGRVRLNGIKTLSRQSSQSLAKLQAGRSPTGLPIVGLGSV